MINYELHKSDDINVTMKSLYDIVCCLRDPKDGCPWDKEQMPSDMVRSMQGEIYEYIDALNENDKAHQREELGDVFLNLFLLGKIHDQNGDFSLSECINEACEKYIRRHPHVFADVKADNTEQVLANWKKIKTEQEGRKEDNIDFFANVARNQPELERCYDVSKKAAKIGFDWKDIDGVYDKVSEEFDEVKQATTQEERLAEIGDLLFCVVQLARKFQIKPQDALSYSNQKFTVRFNILNKLVINDNKKLEELTDEQWDEYWIKAKELAKTTFKV